ncbi:MAG: hypothetical protein KHY76_09285 [Butyricicoccus pullicaecorum]|nr:hypothetical protein [Butyricicoccus pullicaecorum]
MAVKMVRQLVSKWERSGIALYKAEGNVAPATTVLDRLCPWHTFSMKARLCICAASLFGFVPVRRSWFA